jgi:hypothetical protein
MSDMSSTPSSVRKDGKLKPSGHDNHCDNHVAPWWTRISLDNWTWEMLAACLCVCLVGAIVGLLSGYDEKSVPELPEGITVRG